MSMSLKPFTNFPFASEPPIIIASGEYLLFSWLSSVFSLLTNVVIDGLFFVSLFNLFLNIF